MDPRCPHYLLPRCLCALRSSTETPAHASRGPSKERLLGTVVAVFWVRVYLPPIHGVVETLAFLVFGLMAEEFLFRGALFPVARQLGGAWFAIFASATFFSLSHFQYHTYHLTPEAITQVAYTFPMGITFGFLRERSDRLWPVIVVHFITNGIGLLRS